MVCMVKSFLYSEPAITAGFGGRSRPKPASQTIPETLDTAIPSTLSVYGSDWLYQPDLSDRKVRKALEEVLAMKVLMKRDLEEYDTASAQD